ncbi:MAG: choice-of-anchor D domain-containing protein [Bacteroidales bacterium]|nr:choice-of-anchor D domain-containing protein [Bacteroidales bacterium]
MKIKLALFSMYFSSLSILISAQIGTPILSSPVSGAKVYVGVSVTFSWSAVSGATSYDFEFDSGQSYAYLFNLTGTSNPWSHSVEGIGSHTWHVRARNATSVGAWSSARSYSVVGVPSVPSLTSPSNSASIVYGVSTSFSWGASSNAVSYQIQFDSDSPISISGTSYSRSFTTLGSHTWKVQAINPAGASGWSSSRSFTVSLGTPTLSAPSNNSVQYVGVSFDFTWSAASGATSYDFEFDSGQSYAYLFNLTGTSNPWSHVVEGIGSHTWHVRARNGTTVGTWSSSRSYSVVGVPSVPSLSSPSNSASIVYGASTSFSWGASSNAVSYQIQFDSDSPISVSGTSYSRSFTSLGSHVWKVQAINPAGASGWSSSRSFTVSLGTPTLSAPSNNSVQNVGATITYSWSAVSGATSYDFEFDSGQSYAYLFNLTATSNTWSHGVEGIGSHTWHVRARNGTIVGPWSSTFNYTVASPTGTLSVTIRNLDGTSTPLPAANGRAILYDATFQSIVKQSTTNSYGVATLANVNYGTYNLEVYNNTTTSATIFGEEFWGGVSVNHNSASTPVSITRDRPFSDYRKVYINATNQDVTGSSVPAGTTLRIEAKVKNPGTVAMNVKSRLVIDRDKASSYDFDQTSSSSMINAKSGTTNGEVSFNYTFTPTTVGDYFGVIGTLTNTTGATYVITDGSAWGSDPLFSVSGPGSLVVNVKNINGTGNPLPGSNANVKLYNVSNVQVGTDQQTNLEGVATFSDVPVGINYYFKVFHTPSNPATIFNTEYWGKKTGITITGGTATNIDFTRNQPYCAGLKVLDGTTDVTGKTVLYGTTLKLQLTIINPDVTQNSIQGRIAVDLSKAPPYDLDWTETSFRTISANNSTIIAETTFTPVGSGDYFAVNSVIANIDGAPLTTDGSAWSTTPIFRLWPLVITQEDNNPIGTRKPLLLVHGWQPTGIPASSGETIWDNFVNYFNNDTKLKDEFKLYRIRYISNLVSVTDLAFAFRVGLDNLSVEDQNFSSKKISIVAHSMGGLVSRSYMNTLRIVGPFANTRGGDRVEKLITLGTPHHGSPMANKNSRYDLLSVARQALVETFESLFYDASGTHPDYNQFNRSDLRWDNYDNLLNYTAFADEKNDWLVGSDMNSFTVYDNKLIAYAGSFDLVDAQLNQMFVSYAYGASVMNEMGENRFQEPLLNDGIVPYKSATFQGHVVNNYKFFKGYNHSRLAIGKGVMDPTLFSSIKADLLSLTTALILTSPYDLYDFGNIVINNSAEMIVTIQNQGNVALTINNMTISGTNSSQFTITYPAIKSFNLQPNDSQMVRIKFSPSISGSASAQLNITNSSDNFYPVKTISLKGFGDFASDIQSEEANNLSIYPNPVRGLLHIVNTENASVRVKVYDVNSLLILDNEIANGVLDVSKLQSGIYFLKIYNRMFKFIKL